MAQPKASLEEDLLFDIVTHSPEETLAFGRRLAADLRPPCRVLLQGELGSGKTTLVKGIVLGLGVARPDEVTSPSFTLVHEYGDDNKVYHVDLYRVEHAQDLIKTMQRISHGAPPRSDRRSCASAPLGGAGIAAIRDSYAPSAAL